MNLLRPTLIMALVVALLPNVCFLGPVKLFNAFIDSMSKFWIIFHWSPFLLLSFAKTRHNDNELLVSNIFNTKLIAKVPFSAPMQIFKMRITPMVMCI